MRLRTSLTLMLLTIMTAVAANAADNTPTATQPVPYTATLNATANELQMDATNGAIEVYVVKTNKIQVLGVIFWTERKYVRTTTVAVQDGGRLNVTELPPNSKLILRQLEPNEQAVPAPTDNPPIK